MACSSLFGVHAKKYQIGMQFGRGRENFLSRLAETDFIFRSAIVFAWSWQAFDHSLDQKLPDEFVALSRAFAHFIDNMKNG